MGDIDMNDLARIPQELAVRSFLFTPGTIEWVCVCCFFLIGGWYDGIIFSLAQMIEKWNWITRTNTRLSFQGNGNSVSVNTLRKNMQICSPLEYGPFFWQTNSGFLWCFAFAQFRSFFRDRDSAGPLQRFFGENGHGGCGQVSLQALQARRRLVFVEVSGWVDVLYKSRLMSTPD